MTATSYERRGAGRMFNAAETADSRKQVRGFWHRCDDSRDSPAARYLERRGVPGLAGHPDIRFRAETPHPSGACLPAMVALIWSADGNICAVHRTYLTADGNKAPVDPVKSTKGSFSGGAIRLDPAAPELVIGEGCVFRAKSARHSGPKSATDSNLMSAVPI